MVASDQKQPLRKGKKKALGMRYLNIHVKSLRTHVWHLKDSLLKHNIQGSLLWGIFPDQTGMEILNKRGWNLF